jgi:hypothetical protein
MDITKIHTADYATRIGQTAAAEVAGLLAGPDDADDAGMVTPLEIWFDPTRPNYAPRKQAARYADEMLERMVILERLGAYVCQRQVHSGEQLFRYAIGEGLVPNANWDTLSFEQRQPWEIFAHCCLQSFQALRTAQLAIIDARKAVNAAAPAGLKREDSIFEEEDDMFALRPEAVEYLRNLPAYHRGRAEEARRLAATAAVDQPQDDPKPAGKPRGGKRPAALSAGEAPARPPVNKGGRGNKKTI